MYVKFKELEIMEIKKKKIKAFSFKDTRPFYLKTLDLFIYIWYSTLNFRCVFLYRNKLSKPFEQWWLEKMFHVDILVLWHSRKRCSHIVTSIATYFRTGIKTTTFFGKVNGYIDAQSFTKYFEKSEEIKQS